jgi:hypothetical protein
VITVGLVWPIHGMMDTHLLIDVCSWRILGKWPRLLTYSTPWTNPTSARTAEPSSLPTPIARILKSDLASRLWSHGGRPWKALPFTPVYPEPFFGRPPRKDTSAQPMCAGVRTRGAGDAWSICAASTHGSSAGSAPETWRAKRKAAVLGGVCCFDLVCSRLIKMRSTSPTNMTPYL